MKKLIQFALFFAVIILCAIPLGAERAIPLLPPVIAIGFAFLTRNVILSLFCGIYIGALALVDFYSIGTFVKGLFTAVVKISDVYLLKALMDRDHAANVLFLLGIGGMIGVATRSGGIEGIVLKLSRLSKNAVWTQFVTWLLGLVIFVDDYANTLIVGNTMRPLADKHRVSREKLSFIVDATAAPVVSLFVVSTWIGYEVNLIQDSLQAAGLDQSAYLLFLDSLPYRFYAILLLAFIVLSIFMRRDFGPMLTAEQRARKTGKTLRPGSTPLSSRELTEMQVDKGTPKRWYNAAIPILVLVGTVFVGLYLDGMHSLAKTLGNDAAEQAGLRQIIGAADSFRVLLCAALFSSITGIALVVFQKICTLQAALDAWIDGVKSFVIAIVILVLAWALASVIADLKTAEVLTNLTIGILKPALFPLIVFLLSWIVAFATGTSWGTMAILFPLVIPLLTKLAEASALPAAEMSYLLSGTVGAILTGAIFGDHISPISDTTVMSSMFSAVDHMDHVRTQMPYALFVGGVAALLGYLPAGFGWNPFLLLFISFPVIWWVLFVFGKDPEAS